MMVYKFLITAFLLVNSIAVKADWVVIVEYGPEAKFEVENTAFKRNGNVRQFWLRAGTPSPNQKGELKEMKSALFLMETDCVTMKLRTLYWRAHKELNASGTILSESNLPFDANVGDSEKSAIRYICSR